MKKAFCLAVISIFVQWGVKAQNVKLDNTILFSSFNNPLKLPILYDRISTYSINLGVDYLDNKWFYLSSQVGYMKIGGSEENQLLNEEFRFVTETKNYMHLNTTFRVFREESGINFFVGVGPYLNVLVDSEKFDSYYRDFYKCKTYVGGKGEVGLSHDIKKLRVSILGSYLMNFSPVADSGALRLNNNAILLTISTGYLIK